ncbi:hypothetical protein LWI28_024724 [Acer negundo]|uniref:Uncharacterized protein n=1 Tax=Acer negundo TaxID=4023 RepID=A0AAD5I7X3_ACENE|nr:hypothetical protein LWI28_012678 [Acer negundo]KAI9154089.1 hypothetical protein LWI28_020765 [Acer negundo]KAI9154345.1 hypothetical protein LWI28_024724 [Acer negundo]
MMVASWPIEGRIELENLMVRYCLNALLVLKGITCTFKEGTRVGVVGSKEGAKQGLEGHNQHFRFLSYSLLLFLLFCFRGNVYQRGLELELLEARKEPSKD